MKAPSRSSSEISEESEDLSKAGTRKICPKRKSHEKATEKVQTLLFQAGEGHGKAANNSKATKK